MIHEHPVWLKSWYQFTDSLECGKPCDPASGCLFCEPYWNRMIEEGFWDEERHEWTDKGLLEMRKA